MDKGQAANVEPVCVRVTWQAVVGMQGGFRVGPDGRESRAVLVCVGVWRRTWCKLRDAWNARQDAEYASGERCTSRARASVEVSIGTPPRAVQVKAQRQTRRETGAHACAHHPPHQTYVPSSWW